MLLGEFFGELIQYRYKANFYYRIFDSNNFLIDSGNIVSMFERISDDCYYGKVIKVVQTERTMDIYIKRNKQGSASPAPAVPTAREDS